MYPEIQSKKILYINQINKSLFYVNNNELIEIDNSLIDIIQNYSKNFKIITSCNYPISPLKINSEDEFKNIFKQPDNPINFFGFQPKLIT